MKRRSFIAAGSAAVAITAARAVAAPTGPIPIQNTVLQQLTIGVNVPLSGALENYGKSVVKGVQAAVDETNHYALSLKQVFGVRTFDDQGNGQQAVTNTQIAQADPTIIALIGNLTGPVTLSALPSYSTANFALVVPTVTDDIITSRGYRNVFRLPPKNTTEGQLSARTALPQHKSATAIAVAVNGEYGPDTARGFAQQAKADKHQSDVVLLDPKSLDPAICARMVLEKSPTHVFLAGKPSELGPVAEAMRLSAYMGDFSLSDGFYTQGTLDKYSKLFDGVLVASSLPPLERVPQDVQLLMDFQHEMGPTDAFSAYGYSAAQLVIQASQRTNATTRYTLLTTLQQAGNTPYNLLVGNYTFNFNGDATLPNVYFYTITKDGFTFARPAIQTGFVV